MSRLKTALASILRRLKKRGLFIKRLNEVISELPLNDEKRKAAVAKYQGKGR